MLRVSSEIEGGKVDLESITRGTAVQSGVPFQEELLAFAEASLEDDTGEIDRARQALRAAMGEEATVDAAGVIANFQRMVRIADGTGIPLDTPVAIATESIRSDLGINGYGAAENTPPLNPVQRLLGRLLGPFLPLVFKLVARRMTGTK